MTTFSQEQATQFASGELIPEKDGDDKKGGGKASKWGVKKTADDDNEGSDDDDDDDDADDAGDDDDDDDGENSSEWTEGTQNRLLSRECSITRCRARAQRRNRHASACTSVDSS